MYLYGHVPPHAQMKMCGHVFHVRVPQIYERLKNRHHDFKFNFCFPALPIPERHICNLPACGSSCLLSTCSDVALRPWVSRKWLSEVWRSEKAQTLSTECLFADLLYSTIGGLVPLCSSSSSFSSLSTMKVNNLCWRVLCLWVSDIIETHKNKKRKEN